jgi:hypothetical protein
MGEVDDDGVPIVKLFENTHQIFDPFDKAANKADVLPVLRRLPGTKRTIKECSKHAPKHHSEGE